MTMRVICIDESLNKNEWCYPVIFGNEYNITGPVPGYESTHVRIAEHPLSKRGNPAGYNKKHFAPLTGQDETELVSEEFNEKYCVPVNHKAWPEQS